MAVQKFDIPFDAQRVEVCGTPDNCNHAFMLVCPSVTGSIVIDQTFTNATSAGDFDVTIDDQTNANKYINLIFKDETNGSVLADVTFNKGDNITDTPVSINLGTWDASDNTSVAAHITNGAVNGVFSFLKKDFADANNLRGDDAIDIKVCVKSVNHCGNSSEVVDTVLECYEISHFDNATIRGVSSSGFPVSTTNLSSTVFGGVDEFIGIDSTNYGTYLFDSGSPYFAYNPKNGTKWLVKSFETRDNGISSISSINVFSISGYRVPTSVIAGEIGYSFSFGTQSDISAAYPNGVERVSKYYYGQFEKCSIDKLRAFTIEAVDSSNNPLGILLKYTCKTSLAF